jgi:hypothetical protein
VSWFKKLFGKEKEAGAGSEPRVPVPPPVADVPADTVWLEGLVAALAEGKRVSDVGSSQFWSAIDSLAGGGHTLLAAEWLAKFSVAVPRGEAREQILERAAELRSERGEDAEAEKHLLELAESGSPGRAARAHFLLGERFRRENDLRRALRHFEAVLSIDVEYPNARVRVDALRARLGASAPAAAAVDETLAGPERAAPGSRYRLVRELGRGATGAVYLARDAELERDVAVKLLHPHLAAATRREAVARFFDEARTTAALRHPTIVAILDLDETQRRLVMELCAGGTLRARLQRGPLPVEAALLRHVEVLSALDAAHRRGVVHRDLKPANLLFRGDPDSLASELVLCDFGVAHLSDAMAQAAAPQGASARKQLEGPVGTVLYMPPEQRIGAPASPRGDVFAAALILHETLTGRLAWNRADALKGTLQQGALALPRSIDAPAPVLEAIEAHLRRLAAASPEARVSCDEALTSARNLLDLVRCSTDEAALAADRDAVFGARP